MGTELLFTLLTAIVVQGETPRPPSDLQCFKNTTNEDDDFSCEWTPVVSGGEVTHKIHQYVPGPSPKHEIIDCRWNNPCNVARESVFAQTKSVLWVVAYISNVTYTSSNISVTLKDQVKYHAPRVENLSRSSGNLTLRWSKQKDERKGAMYKIQFRPLGDREWKEKQFETEDDEIEEKFTLHLRDNTAYEVQLKCKPRQPEFTFWSEWSKVIKVPIEINHQLNVERKVGTYANGVRLLNLTWKAPPSLASVGGVRYKLSFFIVPCWNKHKTIEINNTNYSINVTASAANLSIVSINVVGESPPTHISVPAYHLDNCFKDQKLSFDPPKIKQSFCVEWYPLTDGKTRPVSVNYSRITNKEDPINKIKEGMVEGVRYHYFVHIGRKQNPGTIASCTIYKMERAPRREPQNVTVHIVTDSTALLCWEPIPVQEQQGFLRNYIINITRELRTEIVNITAYQTNYTIRDLKAGKTYTVHLAGETIMGLGPNKTIRFQMIPPGNSLGQDAFGMEKILIGTCLFALGFTVACSFLIKRFKSKLFPEIPSPVIPETTVYPSQNKEETLPAGEELHAVVLLQLQQNDSSSLVLEECSLVKTSVKGTNFYEDEEESQTDSNSQEELSLSLCPDYKRQMQSLPAQLEQKEFSPGQTLSDVTTPAYRNGLVFEIKGEITPEDGKIL